MATNANSRSESPSRSRSIDPRPTPVMKTFKGAAGGSYTIVRADVKAKAVDAARDALSKR